MDQDLPNGGYMVIIRKADKSEDDPVHVCYIHPEDVEKCLIREGEGLSRLQEMVVAALGHLEKSV